MSPEIKMVGKLTVKSAGVSPKKLAADEKMETLSLCKIYGIADGIKVIEDARDGRIFYPLTGRFQAIHSGNGTITRSGILYLPTGIHESYESAVRKLEEGDSLTFALEIRAVKASNAAGYSYEAVDLMPATESNPLDDLAHRIAGGSAQALPASTTTAAPAAAQAQKTVPAKHPVQSAKPAHK